MKKEKITITLTSGTGYPKNYIGTLGIKEPDIWNVFGKEPKDYKEFEKELVNKIYKYTIN